MAETSGVTEVLYDLGKRARVGQVISATQFQSSDLTGEVTGQYVGYSVWVFSKVDGTTTPPKGEAPKPITAFLGMGTQSPNLPGTVTHNAFSVPLTPGDRVLLLNPAIAAAFGTPIPPITPTPGGVTLRNSVIANWQAAEQDLLTIGVVTPGTATTINFLGVGIQNLAGNIAIRMYVTINGVERRIAPIPAGLTFSVAADAPCIPMINSVIALPGRLRVTVQSNNAADNGAAVTYEAV